MNEFTHCDEQDEEEDNELIDYESVYDLQLVEKASAVLMQALDMIFILLEATQNSSNRLLTTVPETVGWWRSSKPAWRTHFEELIQGYSLGIQTAKDKMLSHLADVGISVIDPHLGSPFDPECHRVVACITGGQQRCIAKVIRYGYLKNQEVLRPADVTVYK